MNKALIFIFALIALASTSAKADFLGLYAGGGIWNHNPGGGFQSTLPGPNSNITLENSLSMTDESEGYAYIAFEHPVPLLPNIRLEKTRLTHQGTTGAALFFFNGLSTSGSATVSLDSTDATLYWRLLDNWVNLDLGLTLRKFDGEFSIGSESVLVEETIPMAYAAVQLDLPFSGLSIGGDINIIDLDDNSLTDTRIRILYEMGLIGFEAGLRTTTIELDDVDNVTTDISFDGLFLGVFLHF